MELRPILSAMTRNKTGVVLVATQIAITLAVVCNAAFIIEQRLSKMGRDPGIDVANIITVQSREYREGADAKGNTIADLRALRAIPGVIDVTTAGSLPLSGGGWGEGFSLTAEGDPKTNVGFGMHMVDEHGLAAYGLELVAGRNFRAEEVVWRDRNASGAPPICIVTQELADKLFPKGGALGQTVYTSGRPITIIGIVKVMHGFWPNWDGIGRNALIPSYSGTERHTFVVRVRPGERDRLMPVVEKTLKDLNPDRMLRHLETLEAIARQTYTQDRAMTIFLSTVIFLLVTVTALGIVGLVSFNVNRRQKQIGTRRALGARKVDVVRYFMLESWLLTTFGAVLGVALAIGLSVWLVQAFDLPKLDWRYLPTGVVVLWVLGQLAAFGPARRAATVLPAIATRNV